MMIMENTVFISKLNKTLFEVYECTGKMSFQDNCHYKICDYYIIIMWTLN